MSSGLGKIRHREFAMASGEMNRREFTAFLRRALPNLARIQHRRLNPFRVHGLATYPRTDHSADECIYLSSRTSAFGRKAMPAWVRSIARQHEFVFVYKNGRAKHINNVELGRFGRSRTNIWEYVGMSSFAKDRDATLAGHPTPKPLALV